jgi:hypothetical protein
MSASTLKERVERELPAYIPEAAVDQETSFSPVAELKQISRLLGRGDDVRLLAADDKGKLRNRVSILKERLGANDQSRELDQIRRLEQLLGA